MLVAIVVLLIAVALAFDFINGFHDAANSIATVVSTRVLSPLLAVGWAAFFNFISAAPVLWGAELKVAATIGKGIIQFDQLKAQGTPVVLMVVFAALMGAIVWNLLTWWFGLPSSSSHALIGGLVGAALAQSGTKGVQWHGLAHKVVIPALWAPTIAFAAAFILLLVIYWAFQRLTPGNANRTFRLGQLASGTWVGFTHGANDAQKTMGVIALALYTHGSISSFYIPTWVKIAAGLAIGLGTYAGGWRIMRTLGQRVFQMDPPAGFAAQASAGAVIWASTKYGYPLSTTHVVSGAVMGAGATKRLSAVRWGVAGNIVFAWVLTIPAAAAVAAVCWWPVRGIFG
jgi:inorganic phosphate transporter, PiT family